MNHPELVKLLIAYTFVGALIFTVVITCLSLVGWIKFADPAQQKKLFSILIVELVGGCLAFFLNFLSLEYLPVAKSIGDKAILFNKERIEPLTKKIDTLPPSKALQVEAEASHLYSPQVNADFVARYPAKSRNDPATAKTILKMQLESVDRSPSTIDAWEKIINKP